MRQTQNKAILQCAHLHSLSKESMGGAGGDWNSFRLLLQESNFFLFCFSPFCGEGGPRERIILTHFQTSTRQQNTLFFYFEKGIFSILSSLTQGSSSCHETFKDSNGKICGIMQHFAKEFKGYHKSYYSEGFHLEGEMQEEEEMIKALNPAAFLITPATQSP